MSEMTSRYRLIKSTLPKDVDLVAVSKYHPVNAISELYAVGQRIFGESRAQELTEKSKVLPKDIEWHFIGHLQRSNVKHVVPIVALIHAVDSFRLLQEINKQAERCDRLVPCLLQIHIAEEESKFGFTFAECRDMLKAGEWKNLNNIRIDGLMCMATNTDDEAQIRNEFSAVNTFFKEIKQEFFTNAENFRRCSWGMSDDYGIAIQEGSNLVRIGSKLFGERNYL